MYGIQPIHIVIIIVVAFLIFGASRLPEIGRSLGRSISEFRKGSKEAAQGFKEEASKPVNPMPATSIQSTAPVGNFCISCGAPNLPEARFCASCGTKLPRSEA